ncbi:MAG TPA: NAD(P)H-dependent oxidoreductase subunit E [Gemmatimonadaceae bacterium]|nr:NAD(P)H-dependent oxidoreductase subunit E [Gemmatimonadaceae bacterium]
MDIKLIDAAASAEERAAVDALLGAPVSQWEGGERLDAREGHVGYTGAAVRARRHLLLPALQAVQSRLGWISEGALNYVCERLNVPPADAWGVATFYALLATTPRPRGVLHVCDDIGCKARGADRVCATLENAVGPAHAHAPHGDVTHVDPDGMTWMRSPCLGMCDHAPAAFVQVAQDGGGFDALLAGITPDAALDYVRNAGDVMRDRDYEFVGVTQLAKPVVRPLQLLGRVGKVDPASLDSYRSMGGYAALPRAMQLGADAVINEITESKLMGRGGAAFPTGRKWAAVASQPVKERYLICNADESEPGTFKDRVLLEGDPFAIVEAMTIAAFATGCTKGYLYIRGEYPLGTARMQHAIDEARRAGLLGENVLGGGFDFDIEIRRGAGAYICGEETAIFNSIEGYRGEPRNKPPFPVQAGLFGKPTVVNNVETLANVPHIITNGGAAFAKIGAGGMSTGTKLFCLSGNVERPGTYEVNFGATLRDLIEMAGGVAGDRPLQAVLLGGAAGVFVRPDELDIPLTFEGVRAAKATLGSGVIMVFDDTVDMKDVVLRIAAFFRDESCGQCVPCRVGTVRQEEALHRIVKGATLGGLAGEVALMHEVGMQMNDASICGLGQTAYAAVESAIHRLKVFGSAS